MRFAMVKKRCVYTWVDELVNAPVEVSATESEQLDPAARRYVVIGCPCYITRNNNSAATGIVNGSYGCVHSLTWHAADEVSEFPQGNPGELIEVPVPKTINVFFKGNVVPVAASRETTTKKNSQSSVYLQRNRHQVDLGFAVTYHKIQGQTLGQVILVMHHRKSKQLLSMCFEMLYVAVTRVRRASDIRVLFFPDGKPGTQAKRVDGGLEHLKQLKRSKHFDAWLASYDKDGNWNSEELLKQADADKKHAMKLLTRNKPLTAYTMKALKPIAAALGLHIENAPGKTYPRKDQFVTAIYPVWTNLKKSKNSDATTSPSVSASSRMRTPAVSRKTRRGTTSSTPVTQKKRKRHVSLRGNLFGKLTPVKTRVKAASTPTGTSSPKIQTPVRRKRNVTVTPPFLGRNLRLGAMMSPVSHKRNRTDSRRKRPRRSLSLATTTYKFPARTRTTIARTQRLKSMLSQLYESILLEEKRRAGTHTNVVTRTMDRMKGMDVFDSISISVKCAYIL